MKKALGGAVLGASIAALAALPSAGSAQVVSCQGAAGSRDLVLNLEPAARVRLTTCQQAPPVTCSGPFVLQLPSNPLIRLDAKDCRGS